MKPSRKSTFSRHRPLILVAYHLSPMDFQPLHDCNIASVGGPQMTLGLARLPIINNMFNLIGRNRRSPPGG